MVETPALHADHRGAKLMNVDGSELYHSSPNTQLIVPSQLAVDVGAQFATEPVTQCWLRWPEQSEGIEAPVIRVPSGWK